MLRSSGILACGIAISLAAAAPVRSAPAQGPGGEALATQACAAAQTQMGAQFAKAFGSLAGCVTKLTPVADSALATCGTDQACISQKLQAAITELSGGSGSGGTGTQGGGTQGGPSAASLAGTIATQACTAGKSTLGKKFRFASVAACKKALLPQALRLARAAVAKCGAKQACLQTELRKSEATLTATIKKTK